MLMDLRPNRNSSNSHSPIHLAVDKGHFEALPLLLRHWPHDRPFARAEKVPDEHRLPLIDTD